MVKLSKLLVPLLSLVLINLILKIWLGAGGIKEINTLREAIKEQSAANIKLSNRNNLIDAEVTHLKKSPNSIEIYARRELDMIKENETFFQVFDFS